LRARTTGAAEAWQDAHQRVHARHRRGGSQQLRARARGAGVGRRRLRRCDEGDDAVSAPAGKCVRMQATKPRAWRPCSSLPLRTAHTRVCAARAPHGATCSAAAGVSGRVSGGRATRHALGFALSACAAVPRTVRGAARSARALTRARAPTPLQGEGAPRRCVSASHAETRVRRRTAARAARSTHLGARRAACSMPLACIGKHAERSVRARGGTLQALVGRRCARSDEEGSSARGEPRLRACMQLVHSAR
jgi:hypothetical protein